MAELERALTPRRPLSRVALRTALAYAAVAGLYILASDSLLGLWVADPHRLARLSLAKGWAFVGVTSVLLYLALRRQLDRWESEVRAREDLEERLRLAQKLELVGRLAGGVAHDFNNVLTVIQGHAELLLPRQPPGSPGRESVACIQEAAERAASLTRQLLAFGRRQLIAPRRVQLNDLVAAIERLLRRSIGEDVLLSTRLSPEVGTVEVDPCQIEQVLLNLALKARDAMPTGGRLTIETSAGELAGDGRRTAVLQVTDTGCGMTPAVRAQIFEPFFTTKEHGHGLGLATAFGIVQQCGGRIEVESEAGAGSRFRVFLPEVAAGSDAAPPPPAVRMA